MRETAKTMLRSLGRALGVLALCSFATVSTAFAENISKTFEFGEGTTQPRSHVRTFPIPCGTVGGVTAVVKFQRLGPDGASNNIPIIIEFREPDTAPDQEGPVVETKSATATKIEQTVILRSQSSNRGCSLPWRVRVRHANEGTAPVRVFGSIRLDFDGGVRNLDAEGMGFLDKGETKTIKLADSSGLQQGTIEITSNWDHSLYGARVPGPNPIKLKWELINPSGAVVKTVEAYSSDESRSELTRFRLDYHVTKHTSGQWKLKITNLTNHDATNFERASRFTPGCSN